MSFGAALAGLGQGFPQGIRDSQGITQQYEAGLEQASSAAAGTGLQLLQALMTQPPQPPPMGAGGMPQAGTSPMPQGGPPMGGQTQQGSGMTMGMGPTGGAPNSFASRFPVASPGGAPIGTEPDIQSMDPNRASGAQALQATMPQGQPQQQQPGMGAMAQVQPQGWGQQQQQKQQQGGQLDWRTLIQAIQRANPGAPPQVIFGAVNKLVPIMNSQSQIQWKQLQSQFAQERIGQGDTRLGQGQQRIDTQRELGGLPPTGDGQQFSRDFDQAGGMGGQQKPQQGAAASIADQIVSGKAPPTTTGMYRLSGPVRADLAQKHPDFNLAQAQLEWKKAERMTQGLTSPQQVRFQQLGTSVINTMDMAIEQAKELQLSGITPLNRAKLEALVKLRGNSEIGQKASKYIQTMAFLKGEVANLENGGYAPTESSWTQAKNVINEDYGVEQTLAVIPNAQRLINYRLHAQQQIPQGMQQGDRYKVPQGSEAPMQQGAPKAGDVHDGYRFKGGDPSKKENWEKSSQAQGRTQMAGNAPDTKPPPKLEDYFDTSQIPRGWRPGQKSPYDVPPRPRLPITPGGKLFPEDFMG